MVARSAGVPALRQASTTFEACLCRAMAAARGATCATMAALGKDEKKEKKKRLEGGDWERFGGKGIISTAPTHLSLQVYKYMPPKPPDENQHQQQTNHCMNSMPGYKNATRRFPAHRYLIGSSRADFFIRNRCPRRPESQQTPEGTRESKITIGPLASFIQVTHAQTGTIRHKGTKPQPLPGTKL